MRDWIMHQDEIASIWLNWLLIVCFVGFIISLCALYPQSVSKVRVGKPCQHGIETLRNMRDFFNVRFVIEPDPNKGTVILKCIGSGMKNLSRKILWTMLITSLLHYDSNMTLVDQNYEMAAIFSSWNKLLPELLCMMPSLLDAIGSSWFPSSILTQFCSKLVAV